MTLREGFVKAANRIEKVGWCQGSYRNGRKLCILGAVDTTLNPRDRERGEAQVYRAMKRI